MANFASTRKRGRGTMSQLAQEIIVGTLGLITLVTVIACVIDYLGLGD